MTPLQKLKHAILLWAADDEGGNSGEVTSETVDTLYDKLVEENRHWDARNEIRSGEYETGFPCESSRHYESKAVAAKMPDGSWVGWTYWYGGGKHSDPDSIDWMEDAYDLDCIEQEKMVVVRTFTKK